MIHTHWPDAIVVARGGGDAQQMTYVVDNYEAVRTLRAFGCPVFAAIGHAKNMTLMDKYADDAFATPTAFANRLTTAFKAANGQMPVADKAIKIAPPDHSIPQRHWLSSAWLPWSLLLVLACVVLYDINSCGEVWPWTEWWQSKWAANAREM